MTAALKDRYDVITPLPIMRLVLLQNLAGRCKMKCRRLHNASKSKPEVQFQYGGRSFPKPEAVLLISFGCHPAPFLPLRPRLSTILCKFSNKCFILFTCHPLDGVTRDGRVMLNYAGEYCEYCDTGDA